MCISLRITWGRAVRISRKSCEQLQFDCCTLLLDFDIYYIAVVAVDIFNLKIFDVTSYKNASMSWQSFIVFGNPACKQLSIRLILAGEISCIHPLSRTIKWMQLLPGALSWTWTAWDGVCSPKLWANQMMMVGLAVMHWIWWESLASLNLMFIHWLCICCTAGIVLSRWSLNKNCCSKWVHLGCRQILYSANQIWNDGVAL